MWLGIADLSVMFVNEIELGSAIYTQGYGRVFNDTFGGRYTAANPMTSPIECLEHVCRLLNYSAYGLSEPSGGWGKGYPSGALPIDVSDTYGGFGTSIVAPASLAKHKAAAMARQYRAEKDTLSSHIVKEICEDWWLGFAMGNDGKCRVFDVVSRGLTDGASDLLTFADIIPGTIRNVKRAALSDLFCEPALDYGWDEGEQKFTKRMAITRATESAYSSDYVTGLDAATAFASQELWLRANALYKKVGQVNTPPESMTQKKTISSEYGAVLYLRQWLTHMGTWWEAPSAGCVIPIDIEFEVALETIDSGGAGVLGWHTFKRFTLSTPFETNNSTVECIVTNLQPMLDRGDRRVRIACRLFTDSVSGQTSAIEAAVFGDTGDIATFEEVGDIAVY
jgi:hypothetical protein